MLRVNRILGEDEKLRQLQPFANAFRGGSWQRPVSASTISRWENARTRVPYLAIRRYEEILGLAPNTLASVIDTVYRYWDSGTHSRLVLGRRADLESRHVQERLESLLEQAISNAEMTGLQWDELTTYLSAGPGTTFLPQRTWTALAERLSTESIISHKLSWMQRFESLNRLLCHPLGQHAAVAACAGLAADAANPISVEPISVLDGSRSPEAAGHVLHQLNNPTNDRTFYGALLACVRKTREHHFNSTQTSTIIRLLDDTTLEPKLLDTAYLVASEILSHLPGDINAREIAALRRVCLAYERERLELAPAKTGQRRTAHTVAHLAAADLPFGFSDETLPVLTYEMLYGQSFDERLYISMLISASPYAQPMARVLSAELAGDDHLGDSGLLCSMIDAIRILGDRSAVRPVARYLLLPGLPPDVQIDAAYAMGHLDRGPDDQASSRLIGHVQADWRQHHSATRLAVIKGLVYGLGISSRLASLSTVRDDLELPTEVRAAAGWWLNLPTYVRESAAA